MNMKKILNAMTAMAAVALLTACDIETSGNGRLDGFWHLCSVDTLQTGGHTDLSERRVFWGVQYKLISLRDVDTDRNHGYYVRFRQTGDSLITSSPYKDNWHQDQGDDGGDHPIDNPKLLAPYGINNLEEGFRKESLNGSTMVLKSKTLRLKFRKM